MKMSSASKITLLIALGVILPVIILFGVAGVFCAFTKETAFQSRALPNIEKALSLSIATPYVDGQEVVQYGVKEGGYAYAKGLRTNDILTNHPDDSPQGNTHKAIYESQKGTVVFHVRRGDEIVKIIFDEIPEISSECPPVREEYESLKSNGGFRLVNWLIKKANGCPF